MADVTLYVFGMASGVGLVPDAGSAATRGVIATAPGKLAALAVTAGLGAAALVAPAGWPPSRRYAPAFVALAASTTLGGFSVVLGGSPAGSLASACLQGVYDFNEALVWSLASCASGGRDRIGLRRGACVAMAFQVAAIAASWLPLDIPAGLGAALLAAYGFLVIVAAYGFLVIVAAVVLPLAGRQDGGEAGSTAEASQAAVADVLAGALGRRCQAVAGAHGLTPREAEVLCLLVQGKSRRAVCQELSMSEGTVKTHIAHIYEKTGVNTREALSDLVFER